MVAVRNSAEHQIARARVTQIERVNHPASAPTLRQRDQAALIADLYAQIAALEERLAVYERPLASSAHQVNGRPVLTAAQAADTAGVSLATVSRYVHDGHWQATREPGSKRWLIYADQALTVKRKA